MRPTILADGRWARADARGPRTQVLGIARFARELLPRLEGLTLIREGLPLLHPLEPIWLTSVLAKQRPRAYFSPGFNPPLRSPVPFVFTLFDLIHLRFTEESGAAKRAYYRIVVRPAVRRARCVLTASDFSKSEIVDWAGVPESDVAVVGCGVGAEFRCDGQPYSPGYRYLLYVGNRRPHKNVPRLLRAFGRADLEDDVRLLFSGDADRATVELAGNLGLSRRITFSGPIADSDLPSVYRGAVALVLPSLYEGFGLPALEAMASGVPVVASGMTSLPEVVGDAAIMVDPHDVDEIANAITRVVEDDSLRARCREKGLERAKAFTWERTANRVSQILERATTP
jgi:glycosyltransferase involved in cell wall biosynthesis